MTSVRFPLWRRSAPIAAGILVALSLSPIPAHASVQHLVVPTRHLVTPPARAFQLFAPTRGAAPATGAATATTTVTATPTTSFPLISRDQQVALVGADQLVEPPDTMVAAGPTGLLELVNRSASAWTKTGGLFGITDMDTALRLPAGWVFSDPRVLYDAPTGRFFFSGALTDTTNDGAVVLAVSNSSNVGSGWFSTTLANTVGVTHDQPKLGVSDDKVVLSWDDFSGGSNLGAETWVLQKAQLLNGVPTSVVTFGPTAGQQSIVPVQSLSSTSTEYLVENGGDHIAVFTVDGVPGVNGVTMVESDVVVPAAAQPPPAVQPGGQLNSGDNRLLSAVWLKGSIWTAGNAGCLFSGSSTMRACSRLLRISTARGPAMLSILQLGGAFSDLIDPGVTVSPAGNVFVAATASSAALYASATVVEIAAGSPAPTYNLFMQGQQTYPGTQWGDYSAVSVDPVTGGVWAAAEYAISAGSPGNWGTAVANLPG